MKGRVLIFLYGGDKKHLIIKNTLSGTQHGEYFGSALTSCDIDNNGDDEIIVGAPLWTKSSDEGRIYIFTNKYNVKLFISYYMLITINKNLSTNLFILDIYGTIIMD